MGSSCSTGAKGQENKNVILDGLQDQTEVWTCASEHLEEAGYETLEKLGAGQYVMFAAPLLLSIVIASWML